VGGGDQRGGFNGLGGGGGAVGGNLFRFSPKGFGKGIMGAPVGGLGIERGNQGNQIGDTPGKG